MFFSRNTLVIRHGNIPTRALIGYYFVKKKGMVYINGSG